MPSQPEWRVRLDFPFTERDEPALRARIEGDLALAARAVRVSDPHARALLLTGGFSRAEGTARDGKPLNDYDLVLVRDRPGGDRLHRGLARRLTRERGIEIDLMPIWRPRLAHVGPKIFWMDLLLGGRVIAGDPGVLDPVTPITPTDVPHQELARLLGNRAAGLLLAIPSPGERPDRAFADLQATKAVLAAMDATLLHRGEYAPRLRDRLALAAHDPRHDAYRLAVEWKLAGPTGLPADWWGQAARLLLETVEAIGARRARDGLAERAVHALHARRLRAQPSQDVRIACWDLLALSCWPHGPASLRAAREAIARTGPAPEAAWGTIKRALFQRRAQTLQ